MSACGLLLLGHFLVGGFLDFQVALSFRLFRRGQRFRHDAFLIGLRLGDGGGALWLRRV